LNGFTFFIVILPVYPIGKASDAPVELSTGLARLCLTDGPHSKAIR
jgi:hypothetical protein